VVEATAPTETEVWEALAGVPDPEIPDVSLVDLGVVKSVSVEGREVVVEFTPTFMGCPALERMQQELAHAIEAIGGAPKLRLAGFAPPAPRPAGKLELVQLQRGFRCPYCGSTDTRLDNIFGPTPCRSIRYCNSCRQPFEQFKTV
jgi:ring-1,2-phenylacetyl-CoA epoxidase subunit PaaD